MIVADHTLVRPLVVLLAAMLVMSTVMLEWARREGWW